MSFAVRLSLHVPEPSVRPGGKPDFSHVGFAPAGEARRPPVDADPVRIPRSRLFADSRPRRRGRGRRRRGRGRLPAADLRQGLRDMMLTRAYDARMLLSQRQGKTSFYIQCLGEEAVACAHRKALSARRHVLSDLSPAGPADRRRLAAGRHDEPVFSNEKDRLKGRQLPGMYSASEAGFFTVSGNLGTQYPQAVGWAMASAIAGDTHIASAWIGDGATAESDFHAALVFASVYRAPVILNVVNNQWAISSYQGIAGGESAKFAARGHGFGIASLRADGNDYLAVYAVSPGRRSGRARTWGRR